MSPFRFSTKALATAGLAIGLTMAAGSFSTAQAHDDRGWHGGPHREWAPPPRYVAPAPRVVYVQPRPVYVEPAPVVVYERPRVYYPPPEPAGLNIVIPLRF